MSRAEKFVGAPLVPTVVMCAAGAAAFKSYCLRWMDGAPAVYEAMLAARPMVSLLPPEDIGWIVVSGDGKRFRFWDEVGPNWTTVRAKATRYARRCDAEAVHAGDEDAWSVVPFAAPELTKDERLVLEWLRKDDGQYGECKGAVLDGLLALGMARWREGSQRTDYGYIEITEAGVAELGME